MVHDTHCPSAAAEHAERYWPSPHEVVSQAMHCCPTLKYPATHPVWQLAVLPCWPLLVKTPLAGRFVHGWQALSALAAQAVRYWPIGQADVLHAVHAEPSLKYPALHVQSHASEPYGLPPEV